MFINNSNIITILKYILYFIVFNFIMLYFSPVVRCEPADIYAVVTSSNPNLDTFFDRNLREDILFLLENIRQNVNVMLMHTSEQSYRYQEYSVLGENIQRLNNIYVSLMNRDNKDIIVVVKALLEVYPNYNFPDLSGVLDDIRVTHRQMIFLKEILTLKTSDPETWSQLFRSSREILQYYLESKYKTENSDMFEAYSEIRRDLVYLWSILGLTFLMKISVTDLYPALNIILGVS